MSRPTFDANAIPAAALCLAATAQVDTASDDKQQTTCTITARTADPVDHWYWGKIVHDLEGFAVDGDRIPLDYQHDPAEVLGYADGFKATKKALTARGHLVPFTDGDRASEIIAKAAAGVPYQASIYFGSEGLELEQVAEGATTLVNGRKFAGPGVVVRKWALRGLAICPYGADPKTQTQFSARTLPVRFTQPPEPETMPEPEATPEAQAATQTPPPAPEAPAETPAATPAAAETPAAPVEPQAPAPATNDATPEPAAAGLAQTPVEPMAPARAELRRFTQAFGVANGAAWFADGKAFADCQTLHAQALQAELDAARAQLAAINRGEAAPLSATPTEAPAAAAQNGLANKIGANVARVAAGIKIPGRN